MQPVRHPRRPRHMRLRAALGLLLALGLLAAPVSVVLACSCAFLGGPVDMARQAIADAEVAFIGTVVGTEPAPPDPAGFGPMVRYAFAVERATVPVDDLIEVRALDDGGGASCGFTFGINETWFVTTDQQDGVLHSGLCHGNLELEALADVDRDRIAAMLTAQPRSSPEDDAREAGWLPIAGIAIAALAVGGTMVFAFRKDVLR
jgi:hypothetical protein